MILGYHSLLEKELEKRISAWSQSVKLGDIFLKIVRSCFLLHRSLDVQASFLKTYNQYIQHYKKANLLLIDLNKNPEFAAMMEVRFQSSLRSDLITAETPLLACLRWQGHQGLLDYACAAHPTLLYALAGHG